MPNNVAEDLLAWRRLGLVVDEDFERGIDSRRRQVRAFAWCAAAATLGLLAAAAAGTVVTRPSPARTEHTLRLTAAPPRARSSPSQKANA